MNLNERLAEKLQKQMGLLMFELHRKDSIIEALEEKIESLTTEKKEETNGN